VTRAWEEKKRSVSQSRRGRKERASGRGRKRTGIDFVLFAFIIVRCPSHVLLEQVRKLIAFVHGQVLYRGRAEEQ
jgi:hypothetical protein